MRKLGPKLFSDSTRITWPVRDRSSIVPGQLILSTKTCCLSLRSSEKSHRGPSSPTSTAFLIGQAHTVPSVSHLTLTVDLVSLPLGSRSDDSLLLDGMTSVTCKSDHIKSLPFKIILSFLLPPKIKPFLYDVHSSIYLISHRFQLSSLQAVLSYFCSHSPSCFSLLPLLCAFCLLCSRGLAFLTCSNLIFKSPFKCKIFCKVFPEALKHINHLFPLSHLSPKAMLTL